MMTNDQRAAWAQDWEQPHMIAGMEELKKACAVQTDLEKLDAGYDAMVIAAGTQWFKQGQANILKLIEDLKKPVKPTIDPGPSFQAPPEYRETRR
ncbi:MAG: hypothetical protein WBD81_18000 [Collimonas pratensis]|uniref:hypothetical protein n=1 Tax=Collimonas pratensis TaxID=279113 RepID=UPI003C74DCA2